MKLVGCVLLVCGFTLVLAALVMLPTLGLRMVFAGAGLAVEVLGLALLTQGYRAAMVQGRDTVRGSGGLA